ncbi:hypothetical protein J7E69_33745, partial [Rhodococcus enclensis]|nr:hypothetical protein [Rhodococcus qingshengii]
MPIEAITPSFNTITRSVTASKAGLLVINTVVWMPPAPSCRSSAIPSAIDASVTAMATDLVSGLRPLRGIGGEKTASARY